MAVAMPSTPACFSMAAKYLVAARHGFLSLPPATGLNPVGFGFEIGTNRLDDLVACVGRRVPEVPRHDPHAQPDQHAAGPSARCTSAGCAAGC